MIYHYPCKQGIDKCTVLLCLQVLFFVLLIFFLFLFISRQQELKFQVSVYPPKYPKGAIGFNGKHVMKLVVLIRRLYILNFILTGNPGK